MKTNGCMPRKRSKRGFRAQFVRAALFTFLAGAITACNGLPSSLGQGVVGQSNAASSASGNYLAGLYARSRRDTTAAADFFAAALAEDPGNDSLLRRTFFLLLLDGRLKEALPLATSVAQLGERDGYAAVTLGAARMASGDYAGALVQFDQVPRSGFHRLMAPILSAWAIFGTSGVDEALKALQPLADEPRFKPFRLYHEALLKDLGGRTEEAGEAYKEVMKGPAGRLLRIQAVYGAFLERSGRTDEARALYTKTLELAPENPLLLAALARLDQGRESPAAIRNASDGAAEAFFGVASVLARDNVRDAAIIYLGLALHLRPGLTGAQVLLAEIRESERRWTDAIALYRSIAPDSPYSWLARLRTASTLQELKRTKEAASLLKAMAAERPERIDALSQMADMYRSEDRFVEAAKAYGEALARIPKLTGRHWSLLYARGIALERSKQWPKAEADFLKALELQPEQPLVLNYLGYSWVEKGLNTKRARAMIEKAVELRPNDGFIVDSLGWVLYRLGDYVEAVKHLEKAVELKPDDPVINDHLGDAYWRVGRRFEARFQWRRALSFEPEKALVPTIEKKLEAGLVPVQTGGSAPVSNGG